MFVCSYVVIVFVLAADDPPFSPSFQGSVLRLSILAEKKEGWRDAGTPQSTTTLAAGCWLAGCLSLYRTSLPLYLSTSLPIYLYLSTYPSVRPSIHPSICRTRESSTPLCQLFLDFQVQHPKSSGAMLDHSCYSYTTWYKQ